MNRKNLTIDIFRFLFAIAIVINHSSLFYPERPFGRGSLGVEFFFIVSGFLMTKKAFNSQHLSDDLGHATIGFVRRKYMQIFYHLIVANICSLLLHAFVYQWNAKQIINKIIFMIPELLCLQMAGFDNLFFATGVVWYLSAMLLVMWFTFPLLVKYKSNISCTVAPLLVFFVYGYLWHVEGHLAGPGTWINNVVYKGLLKAVAGISLGIISYEICSIIQKRTLRSTQKALLTIVEYSCWLSALCGMYFLRTTSYYDFYIVGALFVAITLCFTNQCYITQWINRYECNFFRNASVCLYLNNFYISSLISSTFTTQNTNYLMFCYLSLVLLFSLINYVGASTLRRIVEKNFVVKK